MENPRRKNKIRLTQKQVSEYKLNQVDLDPSLYHLPKEKTSAGALVKFAEDRGWLTQKFHGGIFLRGFPDYLFTHPIFGVKFVETKSYRAGHYLETTQVRRFDQLEKHGLKIWVCQGPEDYDLLFKEPNWRSFIDPR